MNPSSLILLKNEVWLQKQRIAGKCVGRILKTLHTMITGKIPNLTPKNLEEEAVKQLIASDCTPTFFNYKGFPGKICVSVNKELVHGIPSNIPLQEGDVVKFDLGATYQGVIADAASTAIYGQPKSMQHVELIQTCKKALTKAIESIVIGKQLGCIGFAIHKYVSSTQFGLITDYGGHGICMTQTGEGIPHAPPFVCNKARPNEGIRIQSGLVLAIEPLLVLGKSTKTTVGTDKWTVSCEDICAHTEATIFISNDGVEILTKWE